MEVPQKSSNALPLAYASSPRTSALLPIHTPAKPSTTISSARHAGCHVMGGGVVCQLLLACPSPPTQGPFPQRQKAGKQIQLQLGIYQIIFPSFFPSSLHPLSPFPLPTFFLSAALLKREKHNQLLQMPQTRLHKHTQTKRPATTASTGTSPPSWPKHRSTCTKQPPPFINFLFPAQQGLRRPWRSTPASPSRQ